VLIDAIGTQHVPATGAVRIISLVPSLTELLFALGLGEYIVGRTAFCVHPASKVSHIQAIGGTKVVNMRRLLPLQATHLLVNIDENPKALVEELAQSIPHVIVTHPLYVHDNLALYRLLGGIFGKQAEAEYLCHVFETTYAALQETVFPYKRVLYFIWKSPWMTVSQTTYIADMLRLVHWDLAYQADSVRYPVITLDAQLLQDTDLFLFSSEPYHFQHTDLLDFQATYDVAITRLKLIDGEMLSWYGSRAIEGLKYLRQFAQAASENITV
jgi:ABC-type Fe3+-hydroxamate transport system substrate-binding protein